MNDNRSEFPHRSNDQSSHTYKDTEAYILQSWRAIQPVSNPFLRGRPLIQSREPTCILTGARPGSPTAICTGCPGLCTLFEEFKSLKSRNELVQLDKYIFLVGWAQAGCPAAKLVVQRILLNGYDWTKARVGRESCIYLEFRSSSIEIYSSMKEASKQKFMSCGELAFWGKPDPDPISQDNINFLRQCLERCQQRHVRCSKELTPVLPSRVIDTADPRLPQSAVRLLNTDGARGSYAALSYCWGDRNRNFQTTKQTLASNSMGISLGQLPRTFQDAIFVVRGLGIRYLWVDSICIVQDDEDDIHRVLGDIARIYKSATATIAASRADSVTDGFLQSHKDFNIYRSMGIPITLRPTSREEGLVDTTLGPALDVDPMALRSQPFQWQPLNERAWAHTEWLLSTCVMSFMDSCTKFTCLTTSMTTMYLEAPFGKFRFDHGQNEDASSLEPHNSIIGAVADVNCADPNWLHHSWLQELTKYTAKKLASDEDRLPAISGVAALLSPSLGTYVAGIWTKFLPWGLLWRREGPESELPHRDLKAPSWSWASAGGAITHGDASAADQLKTGFKATAKLASHDSEPMSRHAPFGGVRAARLKLKAPMKELWSDAFKDHFVVDRPERRHSFFKLDRNHRNYLDQRWKIYCLELVGRPRAGSETSGRKGLLLDEVSKGCYVRIGYWEIWSHKFERNWAQEVWPAREATLV